jgi:hypothetical protein
MNHMHRDVGRSAGLHLFQELSTLGQLLAHTPLFRQGFRPDLDTIPECRVARSLFADFTKAPCGEFALDSTAEAGAAELNTRIQISRVWTEPRPGCRRTERIGRLGRV